MFRILIFFLFTLTAFRLPEGASFSKDLMQYATNLKQVSFSFKASYYLKQSGQIETESGFVVIDNGDYYVKCDEIEVVHNSAGMLVVDHYAKEIDLFENGVKTAKTPTVINTKHTLALLDSAATKFKSTFNKDGSHIYTINYPAQKYEVTSIKLVFKPGSLLSMVETVYRDNKDDDTDLNRSIVEYQGYKLGQQAKSYFSFSNFIDYKSINSVKLKTAYSEYELSVHKNANAKDLLQKFIK